MKVLLIHAKDFSYEVKSKAIPKAEENVDGRKRIRTQNTLVVFTSIEQSDCPASSKQLSNIAQDICSHARNIKARSVVLYPYAHLSSNLAKPECAIHILENLEITLRKICADVSVLRAPFGWYKSFQITCYGHPLSELSREYRVGSMPASFELSKLLEQLGCKILLKEGNALQSLEPGTSKHAEIVGLLEQLVGTTKDFSDKDHVKKVRQLANKFGVLNQVLQDKGEVILAEIRRLNERIIRLVGKEKPDKMISLGCYSITRKKPETDLRALCSSFYLAIKEAGVIDDVKGKALLTEISWRENKTHSKGSRDELLTSDTAQVFLQTFHDASEALNSAVNLIHETTRALTKCLGIESIVVVTGNEGTVREVISKLNSPQVIGVACSINNESLEITLTTVLGKTYIPLTSVTLLCLNDSRTAVASTLAGPFLRLMYVVFSNALRTMESGKTPYIPVYLSPIQVRVIPVKPEHRDYAEKVRSELVSKNIRVDVDSRNIGLGKRIRDAGREWVPYVVVVGDREVLSGTVNVRMRAEGIQKSMSVDDLVSIIKAACP